MSKDDDAVLTCFLVERFSNPRVELRLGPGGLRVFSNPRVDCDVPPAALVGASVRRNEFVVLALVRRDSRHAVRRWRFRVASARTAAWWARAVRRVARGEPVKADDTPPRRRIVALLNPFSGRRKARTVWRDRARPLFDAAGIDVEVIETKHAGHAAQLGASLDLRDVDGVVTVSGDGLLWETLQGVLARPDWRRVVQRTAFGVVPAGSGNGLAASLGTLDPEVAAATIAIGCTRPIDIAAVRQRNVRGELRTWWSLLACMWGLLSDVDIGSEYMRWMGGVRFTLEGVRRIAKMHAYPGRVAYLPAAEDPDAPLPPRCSGKLVDCDYCEQRPYEEALADTVARHSVSSKRSAGGASDDDDDDAAAAADDGKSKRGGGAGAAGRPPGETFEFDVGDLKHGSTTGAAADLATRVPADFSFDAPPAGWCAMPEREFFAFLVVNQTHLSYDTYATRHAHLSDGQLDLCAIPAATVKRNDAIKLLLEMDTGSAWVKSDATHYRKVFATVVEPTSVADLGIMDADGEEIPAQRTTVEVFRSLVRVYAKADTVEL